MGLLLDGKWVDRWYDTKATDGAFKRSEAQFRNWVTADGRPGPSGEGGFNAESGRYHLYVSHACPWANRTMLYRSLMGLTAHIGVSVVHPDMLSDGWTFGTNFPGTTGDGLFGSAFLRDVYLRAKPDMTGRVTVPVLWDKERGTIVSNESSEIIRMFNSAFNAITGNTLDFYPQDVRPEIDRVNARIYDGLNNGVYKAGFATTQAAYDTAVHAVFDTLDWIEDVLTRTRYLTGDRITEADWRLFPTIARFDMVYHLHFKCNRSRIVDMPNLWGWARELYQWPGIRDVIYFDHIVRHYHYSLDSINPHRIIPINPVLDWDAPHGREALRAA